MGFRVPKTRERLAELEQLGLWQAPREAHKVIDGSVELGPPEPTALVHGDLHLRHLLVDNEPAGRRAVIDWIDLSYNNPGVDLVLDWSVLPPEGRSEFQSYGTIADDQLVCARIPPLFLCGTLAVYGHHEGMPRLKREAVAGLDRTIRPT